MSRTLKSELFDAIVDDALRRGRQGPAELVRVAKEQGLSLTGPDGLLKQLTKTVLETALNEEMTEHLGYEKHDQAGAGSGNIRNGSRSKTVLTDSTGPVQIDVPRDRVGTFEPQIVRKRQRRLSGAGGQGPRPLPERAGRVEVSVSGDPVPGPHRSRQNPMDDALETPSRSADSKPIRLWARTVSPS